MQNAWQTEYYATTSDLPNATLVHVSIFFDGGFWNAVLQVPGERRPRNLARIELSNLMTRVEMELDQIT